MHKLQLTKTCEYFNFFKLQL